MPSRFKRKLVIGVTTVAAAAFAGGAYAATHGAGANTRQAYLNDVAARLHVTPAQLTSALKGAALDQVNAAYASGKLTKAQANLLGQQIQKGEGPPLGPLGLGVPGPMLAPRGFGPGAPLPFGPPGVLKAPFPVAPVPAVHGVLSAAASYLGISATQLIRELMAGKSPAQLAKAHGKSVSGLEAAATAAIKSELSHAVAEKMITSAQEQKLLSVLSRRIDLLVNGSIPGFAFRAPGIALMWRSVPKPLPPGAATSAPGGWLTTPAKPVVPSP